MKKRKWKHLYSISETFVCPYCLKELPLSEMTVEHEPPRSRQKELGPSTKIWACKACNSQKGALTAEEYSGWKRLEFIRNGGLSNQGR